MPAQKNPTNRIPKQACFWSILLFLAAYIPLQSAPPAHATWEQTFSEEFTGSSLDQSRWQDEYMWGRTHNYEAWCAPENVLIEDGLLRLKAENISREGMEYTTGMICSYGKFSQQYGYFEGRFRIPSGQGFWPAFWLLPYPQKWPPEIDFKAL